jgi:hypothetical protein
LAYNLCKDSAYSYYLIYDKSIFDFGNEVMNKVKVLITRSIKNWDKTPYKVFYLGINKIYEIQKTSSYNITIPSTSSIEVHLN